MTAIEAAICVMEREGISQAFGVPGGAINPLYAAMKKRKRWAAGYLVPVAVEFIVERVTNIAMRTEPGTIAEFEEIAGPASVELAAA